ncbi:MAG TPA: Type 1 glutamine amidotransferase-like domain-containing protein [Acidimicrobiales bacterium]|nr:Type 1 glutamine amidotransferase-like domain-containing protein [Acidimicrobiales bacterium]
MNPGVLALVGGDEWTPGCDFDAELLAAAGSERVVVLPTAAAFERPERRVLAAAEWFADLGAEVEGLMVTSRADAQDDDAAAIVRAARFVYLSGGSPLHLRSVLKDSKVFDALRAAWLSGAVVAGAGAGALVLSDPMVDPRGGALTVGLGLVVGLAVVPLVGDLQDDLHGEKLHRSVLLAPPGVPVVGIPGRTAVLRDPDGRWRCAGQGQPVVYVDGSVGGAGLEVLRGR